MKRPIPTQVIYRTLALLLTIPAAARKHPTDPAPRQKVLHVSTQLVQVNVIVDDKHGQPISGLTRGDFKILDEGEPQPIRIFRVEQSTAQTAPNPLPPGIFSNSIERQTGGSPAVTVILLDGLNTSWADQASARRGVLKFLQQIHPTDRVALYALGTQLRVLHDFTSDSTPLVEALRHFRGHNGNELASSLADDADNPPQWSQDVGQSIGENAPVVATSLQAWLIETNNLEAEYEMNQRIEMTMSALTAIAQHLQGVPGRKNLVWVSGAFPLLRGFDLLMQNGDFSTGSTYGAEISRAAQALNDVNLAIYPVDARGLMPDPSFNPAQKKIPNHLPVHLDDNFSTMDQFAQRTGGRAFYNSNDIQGSIRTVLEDSRLTYLLGYYPNHGKWDGEYRKIKVTVDRPDLRLQYRNGYSAVPEEPPAPSIAQKALDAAVLSPLDATALACVVKPVALETPPGQPPSVEMQYWIDPANITLAPDGNQWQVHITMVVEEVGPKGESLKGVSHQLNFNLNSANRKDFLVSGLRYNEPLPIVPHAERIRVVVRDDPSGDLGSLSIPVDRVLTHHGG